MNKIFTTIIFAISFTSMYGQYFCETEVDSNHIPVIHGSLPESNDTVVLKVYLHSIKDNNGEGGYSDDEIEVAKCILARDFRPYNIFFDFQPTIHYTSHFYYYYNMTRSKRQTLQDSLVYGDGINIFFGTQSHGASSWAADIVSNFFALRGLFPYTDIPQGITSTITHEMGHCLGLYHTHEWMFCSELVDGSNCTTCGDLVCDTEADHSQNVSPIFIKENCEYNWDSIYYRHINHTDSINFFTGKLFDANGDTLNPNNSNFMSYTWHYCLQEFSQGQVERMKYFIYNEPILTNCTTSINNISQLSSLDLMTKTTEDDDGSEPNYTASLPWKSPDIWIRNSPDGFDNETHQNPIYDSINNNPVYVYVKVRNIGCEDFEGEGHLKLYWAQAATALTWPNSWINNFQNGIPMGGLIDSIELPYIQGKDSVVFEFEWHLEDPSQYTSMFSGQQPWHYCLLSRIVTQQDPMANEIQNNSVIKNVLDNNNIAWKNVYIIYPPNIMNYYPGGVVAIGSVNYSEEETYNFSFFSNEIEDSYLTDETEITITLSDEAWQKWDEGGRLSNHIEVYNEETRQLIIMENNAKLKNLTYQPGVRDVMSLSFNFLMEELTEIVSYDFEAVQESLEGEIVGGETYTVIKDPDRIIFFAEAGGDKHIDKGDSIGLTANEPENDVVQNWYSNNVKIASGESVTVEPNTTTEYVLEIIAKDGYKDYDTIVVNVANNYIKNLNPNPANQEISVEYVVDDINNHYICIVNNSGNIVSTHNLSQSQSIITINIQNISSGSYYCQIRSGQQVLSSKPFVKQ